MLPTPSRDTNRLIRSLSDLPRDARGCVLAVGNFDGVHRGHRFLVSELQQLSRQWNAPSIVFTFDPPPVRLLRPGPWPMPLTWMERRAELLHTLGVDFTIAYPTSCQLLSLDALTFFEEVLVGEFGMRGLVEGPNFRFGKDRGGDVQLLEQLCKTRGIALRVVEPQKDGDEWVSSSAIRESLEQGRIEKANLGLVEPYRLLGLVEHGAARGRTLGFPTANLGQVPVLIPAHGVYAGRVVGVHGRCDDDVARSAVGTPTAVHIGPNPTFGESVSKVEAHLIGFSGDLYGATLEVELLARVRDVHRFASKEALLDQLGRDLARVVEVCGPSLSS